jgi:LPXTG-motif cell wall-anchored protein
MLRRCVASFLAVAAVLVITVAPSPAAPAHDHRDGFKIGVDTSTATDDGATVALSRSASDSRTGDDTEPLVLAGLAGLAVGAALVLTARRRRAQRLAI